jgi:hypothetical protein
LQTPIQILNKKPEFRDCGECTKCCEGYLYADLKFSNRDPIQLGPEPCPILNIGFGCGDYENRPQSPCRGFQCEWTRQPQVYPESMRPDRINTIFSLQDVEGVQYLRVTEAGSTLDAETLSFAIKLTLMNRYNIYWEVNGKAHWFGNKDFVQIMNREKDKNLIIGSEAQTENE